MDTQLYAELEESTAEGTLERTLRLLIQHIPQFPGDCQLRRLVLRALAGEGLVQQTRPVLQRIVEIDRVRGRIPGLVATARLAEQLGLPSEDAWLALESLLARRADAPQALPEPTPPQLDPSPDQPTVGRDALLALAAEVAARPLQDLHDHPVVHVPLLSQLSAPHAMELLRALRLTIAPAHSPAVSSEGTAAWLVMGAFAETDQPAHWLPEGTLLTRHTPHTSTTAWILAADEAGWERLCAQPDIVNALQNSLLSAQAAAIIGRSALTHAVGPSAIKRLLAHALAFTAPAGVIRPAGEPSGGVGMIVGGALSMALRHDENRIHIETLHAGDTFGAESGADADVALLELASSEPVRWIWLPEDHTGPWLSEHPAALAFLAAQAASRTATLRRLRDALPEVAVSATEFDDSAQTSVQGAGSPALESRADTP
jgi:hypothetical protein